MDPVEKLKILLQHNHNRIRFKYYDTAGNTITSYKITNFSHSCDVMTKIYLSW
jgi:hypothetical protein